MRPSFAISCLALTLISGRFSLGARLDYGDERAASLDTDKFRDGPGSANGAIASELTDVLGKPIDANTLYHYYVRLSFDNPEAWPLELELIAGFRIRVLPEDAVDVEPPKEDRCILRADEKGARTVGGTSESGWKLQPLTLQELLEELFGSESKAPVAGKHMQEEYEHVMTTWQSLTVIKPSMERPYHAVWYNCQAFAADIVNVAVPDFGNVFQQVFVSDARKITGVNGDRGVGSAIYGALGTAATQMRVPKSVKSFMGGPWRSIWDRLLEQRSVNHLTYDALDYLRLLQRSQAEVLDDFDQVMDDIRNADPNVETLRKYYAGLKIKQLEVWMAPVSPLAALLTHPDEIKKVGKGIEKAFGVESERLQDFDA